MNTLARTAATEWAKAVTANPMTIFLDTETLGKEHDAEICDIGIVGIDGRVWMDQLVKPSVPIPDEASAIHHITNEMVEDAPPWGVLAADIADMLNGACPVIYNAGYDVPILDNAFKRAGLKTAVTGQCAMLEYAKYMGVPSFKGQYKWHRLEVACAHFNITPGGHRALADAIACKEVVCAMAGGQYCCPSCNKRLAGPHTSCDCWQSPAKPQRSLFDLPDATKYTR